jgi:hypothetical protein
MPTRAEHDLTMAEWLGFSRDCGHDRLSLLPVVDTTFTFMCADCRGQIRLPWMKDLAGLGIPELKVLARKSIRAYACQLVPQAVLDAKSALERGAESPREIRHLGEEAGTELNGDSPADGTATALSTPE